MLRDCRVAQFVHEIGAPIPLQSGWVDWIEQGLQGRLGQGTDKVQRGFFERANRFEHYFGLRLRRSASPNDSAHLFEMEIFRERRPRRNGKKRKPSVQIVRR